MSKAWAEQLLTCKRGGVPLAIVRPAILASTLAEPAAGWLTGLRMADPLVAAMGRSLLHLFPGDPTTNLDLVPCDLAANAVLAALPRRVGFPTARVYQVAGSDKNPLTLGDFGRLCHAALRLHPFRDQTGAPIEPSQIRLVAARKFARTLSRDRRRLALKLAVLERIGFVARARSLRGSLRFLRYAHQLGRAYAPYTERHFRFATEWLDELDRALAPQDRALFPTDVGRLDWTRFLTDVHVPAVRREAGGDGSAEEAADPVGPPPPTLAAAGD